MSFVKHQPMHPICVCGCGCALLRSLRLSWVDGYFLAVCPTQTASESSVFVCGFFSRLLGVFQKEGSLEHFLRPRRKTGTRPEIPGKGMCGSKLRESPKWPISCRFPCVMPKGVSKFDSPPPTVAPATFGNKCQRLQKRIWSRHLVRLLSL